MIHTLQVADIMSTSVVTIGADECLDAAEEVMRLGKIHHLPVVEDGQLVGMVAQSDILRAQVSVFAELSMSEDREIKRHIAAREVMVEDVKTIGPEATAVDAARMLEGHEYSSLPVVKDGDVVGIITQRDFLSLAIRALEAAQTEAAKGNNGVHTKKAQARV